MNRDFQSFNSNSESNKALRSHQTNAEQIFRAVKTLNLSDSHSIRSVNGINETDTWRYGNQNATKTISAGGAEKLNPMRANYKIEVSRITESTRFGVSSEFRIVQMICVTQKI